MSGTAVHSQNTPRTIGASAHSLAVGTPFAPTNSSESVTRKLMPCASVHASPCAIRLSISASVPAAEPGPVA